MHFSKSLRIVAAFVFGAGLQLSGHAQTINWLADTTTNYDVTITGSGHVGSGSFYFQGSGWAGSTTSPSGKWTVYGELSQAFQINHYEIDQVGSVSANNIIPPQPGSFADYFEGSQGSGSPVDSFAVPSGLVPHYDTLLGWHTTLSAHWNYNLVYDPTLLRTVAEFTDWTFEFSGSGPALTYVPEPTVQCLFGVGLVGLALFRRCQLL